MAFLELDALSKHYAQGATRMEVLRDINLEVAEGEFLAIVGFSGSGKTTLLSLLAGLISPDSGSIRLRGAAVSGPGPDRGVVFQSYALLPWLTVRDNIALAVDAVCAARSRRDRAALVEHYIELVGLGHAALRKPAALSGGMRQRVAVARALATQPDILLLDEPLSALDALTRARLQDEIERISQAEGKTVILVTNDVDEALLLADRIVPLTPGPGATLGPQFIVNLPRPRERASMNDHAGFKALRAEVTRCLLGYAEQQARDTETNANTPLPAVTPITQLVEAPPRAYQDAARSAITRGYVEFHDVTKTYATPDGPLNVVEGFNLKMERGEVVSLIGHSGCGKSTVLSMMAGLTEISGGGIILDGREIWHAGPDRAVVFQAPSLLPWLSARDNVMLGVDKVYPHAQSGERRDIAEYYLERVGLGAAMERLAGELSNGMQQRVGIARAFALSPKLLLLDEPFGMLDSLTRWDLQEVLMEVWKRTQVTTICITHDVDEALLLADRVVMMSNGPRARVGHVMSVDLPRPRTRQALLNHPRYYELRREVLNFLGEHDHVATPGAATPNTNTPAKPGVRGAPKQAA
ncbi:MAG: ATP-binding cassette domain-containing protein [Proteobacteria bacterium]|nr:ATP-binding cassette domain-containing protein [Pseudomonadota bacterium]